MALRSLLFASLTLFTLLRSSEAQYETVNHICGGWFRFVWGSIEFNFVPTTEDEHNQLNKTHACAWTVSGTLPSQYSAYDITIQRLPNTTCNTQTTSVGISHFNVHSETVTAANTWRCGAPQVWNAVPGTIFFVVLTTTSLQENTGFNLTWSATGDRLDYGTGIRTNYYSWGKPGVEPYNYYSSGTIPTEISSHVFSKGNRTSQQYSTEMEFWSIELDECSSNTTDCSQFHNSTLLVCSILESGAMMVSRVYHAPMNQTDDVGQAISSPWGLVLLIWSGDFFGAGSRFTMEYHTVRND